VEVNERREGRKGRAEGRAEGRKEGSAGREDDEGMMERR
jgi:hypothetical protein